MTPETSFLPITGGAGEGLQAFIWDARFETGIALVDTQHRGLVELLNVLVAVVTGERKPEAGAVVSLLDQLDAYARQHFADEEAIMWAGGCPRAHDEAHARQHAAFAEQIRMARAEVLAAAEPDSLLEPLARFVTSWLSFHILGSDQEMARLIGEAPQAEHGSADAGREAGRTAVLVDAMQHVYALMAERNSALAKARDELAQLNAGLEARVRERTAQLQAALDEVRSTREQLVQAEKMSAIGRLAAGVAHEINNPIGFVVSNIGTLRQYVTKLTGLIATYDRIHAQLPFSEAGRQRLAALKAGLDYDFLCQDLAELLGETETGLARVKRIVRDMKTFSEVGTAAWQMAELNAVLAGSVDPLRASAPAGVTLETALSPLPPLECQPSQLAEVFANLVTNALQAVEPGEGRVVVASREDGDWLEVEVRDNGCGMPPEVSRHVFEPFFTTRPVGQGTGLGLSVSYEIVKHHGGEILLDSSPGEGTRVRVRLPKVQAEGNPHPPS